METMPFTWLWGAGEVIAIGRSSMSVVSVGGSSDELRSSSLAHSSAWWRAKPVTFSGMRRKKRSSTNSSGVSSLASLPVRVSMRAVVHQLSSSWGNEPVAKRSFGVFLGQASVAFRPDGMQTLAVVRPSGLVNVSTGRSWW